MSMITLLSLVYVSCVSSTNMLSMLLLLVVIYVSAGLWLIANHLAYIGLLYILVYVGAIVVLIIFVVQLTNTSLTTTGLGRATSVPLWVNIILISGIGYLFIQHGNIMLATASLTSVGPSIISTSSPISNDLGLTVLASSLFNEHAYVLVLSVHAILLAIIGPIKLALNR